jgi:oligopeptide transport system permease protein
MAISGRSLNFDAPPMLRSGWTSIVARMARSARGRFGIGIFVLIALFAVFGPALTPWTPDVIDWNAVGEDASLRAPSLATGHPLGVDDLGRDLFARLAHGTQTSLTISCLAVAIAVICGTAYGAIAGYVGGVIDQVMMRIVDTLYALPMTFVLVVMVLLFGQATEVLFICIGGFSSLGLARVVRGQTLVIKTQPYVEAAVIGGARPLDVVFTHIVPNLLGLVAIYATILVPELVFTESLISFMGLGVQDPDVSLGVLISEGMSGLLFGISLHLACPLLMFVSVQVALYCIGDGLREASDVKGEG